jgi:hypothetical protein
VSIESPHRMPVQYDVIAVCPDVRIDGRDYTSVRLTVSTVSLDGSEVDATETTGGRLIHLLASQFRLVSPPRGAW